MEQEKDYIRDITEIRSIMERTTKFFSLSGWAGIMVGIYAFAGAYVAYTLYGFNPTNIIDYTNIQPDDIIRPIDLIVVATAIIFLAIGTVIYFSRRMAIKRNEPTWNATTRRLLVNMFVPLIAGGVLSLILISNGLIALVPSLTLIFYGLSLHIASHYTYNNLKLLGMFDIVLGLAAAVFINYSLLFWVIGFGVGHIVYGIFVHYTYKK